MLSTRCVRDALIDITTTVLLPPSYGELCIWQGEHCSQEPDCTCVPAVHRLVMPRHCLLASTPLCNSGVFRGCAQHYQHRFSCCRQHSKGVGQPPSSLTGPPTLRWCVADAQHFRVLVECRRLYECASSKAATGHIHSCCRAPMQDPARSVCLRHANVLLMSACISSQQPATSSCNRATSGQGKARYASNPRSLVSTCHGHQPIMARVQAL